MADTFNITFHTEGWNNRKLGKETYEYVEISVPWQEYPWKIEDLETLKEFRRRLDEAFYLWQYAVLQRAGQAPKIAIQGDISQEDDFSQIEKTRCSSCKRIGYAHDDNCKLGGKL